MHYKFFHYNKNGTAAFFKKINYADGEIKGVSNDLSEFPIQAGQAPLDYNTYYRIDASNQNNITPVELDDIIESENQRITDEMEKGNIPIGLTEEQEEINKTAMQALEEFMKRRKGK